MLRPIVGGALLSMLAACASDPVVDAAECVNQLSEQEAGEGWRLLFDGESLAQWRSYREETVNSGWGVENGPGVGPRKPSVQKFVLC